MRQRTVDSDPTNFVNGKEKQNQRIAPSERQPDGESTRNKLKLMNFVSVDIRGGTDFAGTVVNRVEMFQCASVTVNSR